MRKPSPANAKQLTDEQLAELKENALGILSDTRRDIISLYPFVGSIAMNLDLVPTRDIDNPTAATDGDAIYFDIAFLAELRKDERMFVLAHEVWHNVMLHFMRVGSRDRKLFNLATDMEVNQLLRKDGFTSPKDLVWPENYGFDKDLPAEEYYELLLDRQKFQKSSSSNGKDSDGALFNGGNDNGQLDRQFDKHICKDDAQPKTDADKANVSDKYGKVGHDPDFRPMPSESGVEKIREAAVTAAQEIERSRGTLPDHIKRIVNELLEPEIRWTDVLAAHVTRVMGDKSNWNHPNRRFAYSGTYLPSHDGEKLRIAVGIDTSGSTNPDLKRFLSELNGLVQSFGNYEIHVIQCDTKVQDYALYDESNLLDLDNKQMEMHGGGGTVLKPIFDYIEDNELEVDTICMFTDGYCEKFTEDMAPEYPVLWLVSHDGTTENLKFGEVIKFDKPNHK